ncbi:MAG TPA: hypothetical protein DCM62_10970, partial [Bacteroidales bacterium]|nr:hypothetical protein [Bacteroidales bacterium]
HNSYNLPDHINQLNWDNKGEYYHVFSFYKDLIRLRKNHPAFRMTSVAMIQKHLSFLDVESPLVVGFLIANYANGDDWEKILVFYNGANNEVVVELPEGQWIIVATKNEINELGVSVEGFDKTFERYIALVSKSITILVDKASVSKNQCKAISKFALA